jgi:hypothetical protein
VVTVDDVRTVALELPRAYEVVVRGRLKLRVGSIVWLAFSRDEERMGFAFPKDWREVLIGSEPEKFLWPEPVDLRYNWAVARLAALEADEMQELVLDAWAFVVQKRVADEYFGG